jgi:hypothetical protein
VIAGLPADRSPRCPRLWWSRPMPADVCSMFARMPRYTPAASGIRNESRILATGQNDSSRHVSASPDTSSEQNNRIQERTLNQRVGGSSPSRRTQDDLGFYHPRSFYTPDLSGCWLRARAAVFPVAAGALSKTGAPTRPMRFAPSDRLQKVNGTGRRLVGQGPVSWAPHRRVAGQASSASVDRDQRKPVPGRRRRISPGAPQVQAR